MVKTGTASRWDGYNVADEVPGVTIYVGPFSQVLWNRARGKFIAQLPLRPLQAVEIERYRKIAIKQGR